MDVISPIAATQLTGVGTLNNVSSVHNLWLIPAVDANTVAAPNLYTPRCYRRK